MVTAPKKLLFPSPQALILLLSVTPNRTKDQKSVLGVREESSSKTLNVHFITSANSILKCRPSTARVNLERLRAAKELNIDSAITTYMDGVSSSLAQPFEKAYNLKRCFDRSFPWEWWLKNTTGPFAFEVWVIILTSLRCLVSSFWPITESQR